MEYLRYHCIEEKRDDMIGVITNSREWIFARYDMKGEI
jgi:hypothetical protein